MYTNTPDINYPATTRIWTQAHACTVQALWILLPMQQSTRQEKLKYRTPLINFCQVQRCEFSYFWICNINSHRIISIWFDVTVGMYVDRMTVCSSLLSCGFIPTMDTHCSHVCTDSVFTVMDLVVRPVWIVQWTVCWLTDNTNVTVDCLCISGCHVLICFSLSHRI